jgi:PAS domain S-box-containing protein
MATYAPLRDALHAGRRLVINNTQTDPEVASIRDALAALEIHAHLVLPLMRDGQTVAAFVVHQRRPRNWTEEEAALAAEAAGRAWAEVSRARAETALRDVNAHLGDQIRALARAADAIVWTTDVEGRIVDDSPSWRIFTGQTPEQCIGSAWQDAIHPDDRDSIAVQWADSVRAGTALDTSYRLRHAPSDGWHRIRMHAIPLQQSHRPPHNWLAIGTDLEPDSPPATSSHGAK